MVEVGGDDEVEVGGPAHRGVNMLIFVDLRRFSLVFVDFHRFLLSSMIFFDFR